MFTLLHRLGTRPFRSEALEATAVLAHRAGDHKRAGRYLRAAQGVRVARAENDGSIDVLADELAAVRAGLEVVTPGEKQHEAAQLPMAFAVAETRLWLQEYRC